MFKVQPTLAQLGGASVTIRLTEGHQFKSDMWVTQRK